MMGLKVPPFYILAVIILASGGIPKGMNHEMLVHMLGLSAINRL